MDQVNAISEMVMNTLQGNVTLPSQLLDRLRPHKRALCDMARRKHSVKRRRHVMMSQTGAGLWNASDRRRIFLISTRRILIVRDIT